MTTTPEPPAAEKPLELPIEVYFQLCGPDAQRSKRAELFKRWGKMPPKVLLVRGAVWPVWDEPTNGKA